MPALITPFTRSGNLNLAAFENNVVTLWRRGIKGFLVGGSTGEGPYLEPGERGSLAAAARNAAPAAFILSGVHTETVGMAVAAVAEAEAGGADAALVVTPTTLVRHRPDLIEGFFRDVVAAANLPILLYSVPKVTGVELAENSVAALSRNDRVVGMKDSGGDPVRAGRIAAATDADFTLFAGATPALSLSVGAGAYGAITASANYAAGLVAEVIRKARRSVPSAAETQARLANLSRRVEQFGIGAVKYAAGRTGLSPGLPRRPLRTIGSAAKRKVDAALRDGGVL